mmetsp:Transcript_53098/g.95477  ORF Transcript_53098/g.95477 Transcript_53098/m.95477 type:complete len:742 (-) Transcript_53098:247-2472(-)
MSRFLTLMPTRVPHPDLVYSNQVYVCQDDFAGLCEQPSEGPAYVEVKGCIFTLCVNSEIQSGTLGLSEMQRKFARIGLPPTSGIFVKCFEPPPSFGLGSCSIAVDFIPGCRRTELLEIRDADLETFFKLKFEEQVLAVDQILIVDFESDKLMLTVKAVQPLDFGHGLATTRAGILSGQTELNFQPSPIAAEKIQMLSTRTTRRVIFNPDFNFNDIGVGGLNKEFCDIFRRVFAARICPAHIVRSLGMKHVRGMLLYGPPGTGKTLIARQLAQFLNAVEPKIVNGPEIFDRYVGAAEQKVRELFADAEKDQSLHGDNSPLHVIILDEMDAIAKKRGMTSDGTGVSANIVNQMLSKMDGMNGLNNILLIGMTNRKDMIDTGLLRPGRFELHVEIGLPDEAGRVEILNIRTAKMRENGFLEDGVSLQHLASKTRNFSGAELEGLVKAASSNAMSRKVDLQNLANCSGFEDIRITATDFQKALTEVQPAFGQDHDALQNCIEHGIIEFSDAFKTVLRKCTKLVEQVRSSESTSLLSVLLVGPPGSGKTALAAHLAHVADFPFARLIGSEDFAGYSEQEKIAHITQIFDDAHKSPLSVVILDDVEQLMDFASIGPRFSNGILQLFFSLLKRRVARPGHRMLVVGTTSEPSFMRSSKLMRAFNAAFQIPLLSELPHFQSALGGMPGFSPEVVEEVSVGLGKGVGIGTLLQVAEMATYQSDSIHAKQVLECFHDAGFFNETPDSFVML